MNFTKLEYLDGSGNAYKITTDSISYFPITRKMSSSGMYDGGKEAHKSITKSDFENLLARYDGIFTDKSIHIKDRIKTSGVLVRYTDKNVPEEIIISKSDEQQKLEEFLKILLKD